MKRKGPYWDAASIVQKYTGMYATSESLKSAMEELREGGTFQVLSPSDSNLEIIEAINSVCSAKFIRDLYNEMNKHAPIKDGKTKKEDILHKLSNYCKKQRTLTNEGNIQVGPMFLKKFASVTSSAKGDIQYIFKFCNDHIRVIRRILRLDVLVTSIGQASSGRAADANSMETSDTSTFALLHAMGKLTFAGPGPSSPINTSCSIFRSRDCLLAYEGVSYLRDRLTLLIENCNTPTYNSQTSSEDKKLQMSIESSGGDATMQSTDIYNSSWLTSVNEDVVKLWFGNSSSTNAVIEDSEVSYFTSQLIYSSSTAVSNGKGSAIDSTIQGILLIAQITFHILSAWKKYSLKDPENKLKEDRPAYLNQISCTWISHSILWDW